MQRRRIRDAAMVGAQLEHLSVWAERTWPDHWHSDHGDDLGTALAVFLSDGAVHAKTLAHLEDENNAVLARALLIGIGRSASHPISQLEAAIGLPFPSEAHPS